VETQLLSYEPLTGAIGAVVTGIDLTEPQPDAVITELDRAVADHGVLFFVDQHELTPGAQVAFGAQLGELWIHPWVRGHPDHPEVMVLAPENLPNTPGEPIRWHADATFAARPPRGSILRAVELPPVGGDTLWANMAAAYESLSSSMQRFLDGLSARHVSDSFQRLLAQGKAVDAASAEMQSSVHPVITTHPVTGRRGLYVNTIFTTEIVELSPAEGASVLAFLYDHIKTPDLHVRWRWQPGSVAFWDNRATQHHVTGGYAARREMHRVTLQGDEPK